MPSARADAAAARSATQAIKDKVPKACDRRPVRFGESVAATALCSLSRKRGRRRCGASLHLKSSAHTSPVRTLASRHGGLGLREQAAEARKPRHAGSAADALEAGPDHRLIGIDARAAGLALDRVDCLDLCGVGAA